MTIRDVAVGAVWLAGGQSNMEYELQNMIGGEEIMNTIDNYSPFVRFYYTQKKSFIDEDFLKSESETRWEIFTDEVIKLINKKEEPVVFILWGSDARSKKSLITNKKHLIIESAHPSPFSARNGFFGSKPFSKTNEFLKKNNIEEIDWRVE